MHHRRAGLALAIFAASALACPAAPLRPVGSRSSERADLYVSPAGTDTNPGTASSPLLTIIEASRLAEPGTTVHVAPGVYPGGFRTTASGTSAAPIRYRSDRKWGAKIVPAEHSVLEAAWDNRGNNVEIDGFEIDGTTTRSGTPWVTGIYVAGSHDVVTNNFVHDIAKQVVCTSHGGAGIGTDHYYYGTDDDVVANIVHDVGPSGCRFIQGIYISTSGNVKNNLVYRIAEVGIHLWHDATHVNIVNNTVVDSEIGILVGGGDRYHLASPNDYTYVANNIVYGNRVRGIIEHGITGRHNIYTHNLVGKSHDDYRLQNGLTASDTILGDPLFVHPGTDFHLRAGSPAIGSGTPTGAPATDLDGVSRGRGTGFDLGAYAHRSGS
jgi:hypothetical protein